MTIILTGNNKENMFLYEEDINTKVNRIDKISNQRLIEEYYALLLKLMYYKPIDDIETEHIINIRKAYVNEFMIRITGHVEKEIYNELTDMVEVKPFKRRPQTVASLLELAKKLQHYMSIDKTEDIQAQTIDMLRIYSVCLREVEKRGFNKKQMKKEFL